MQKYIECPLVCYEGKDKFIQRSILSVLRSVMRRKNMNTAMHKNVIICNLILQSISFENALNTFLFLAVLKMKQTYAKIYSMSTGLL